MHDYAPKIKCLILGSPALNINLYVPFARSMLSLYQFIRGTFFIKSYVYKVILINVQKILNKYVHMLSYMSCIEGAHYDNRIQCNHRFTYTVCW